MSSKVVLAEGTGASFFDVYFLGIALVIAGHSVYWTFGFAQGFWEFFTSTMVTSLAYFCLCMCLSEMISILPFSGGAYGFARVTTGPYFGFIVGFFDSVSNIIYVSLFIRTCVTFFQFCFYNGEVNTDYDPLWWAVLYVGLFSLHLVLQKYSFKFISLFGFICLLIPIIFVLGTAHLQDFKTNVVDLEKLMKHVPFEQGTEGFVRLLPLSSLMYFGVDMVCLVCEDTRDAVRVVPKVVMAIMVTLFLLAMALVVCVAAQPPTILYEQYISVPMSFGFAEIFHTTINYGSIYVLPSQFIVIYALMYVYGRQICALSRSTLVPSVFSWTTRDNCPYMAMILGNVFGFVSLIALKYGSKNFDSTLGKMYYAAQMGSITVYIVSMISFIIFRYKYSALERHFVNFGGIPSAVIGIATFAFTWVGLGFYELDRHFIIKLYAALFGAATVYYVVYARRYQSFSEEEQSILFAVYIIKANTRHKTLYRAMEKRFRHVLNYVDPDHSFFSSGVKSPSRNHSRSNSHRQVSSTVSKVHPTAETRDGISSKPDISLEPVQEVLYIGDADNYDHDLDEKVKLEVRTKSTKTAEGNVDTAASIGGVEMKLKTEESAHPLEELVEIFTPENIE